MWYRVFASQLTDLPPSALVEALHEQDFAVESHFRGDDLGWFGCEFRLGVGTPVYLERFLAKEDEIRDDLNTWAAWVEAQHYEPRRFDLMEKIVQTRQLFALRKPIDHSDEVTLDRFCLAVVQWLAKETGAVYQIDGKGFFDAAGGSVLEEY
jgi:hypothetical protein